MSNEIRRQLGQHAAAHLDFYYSKIEQKKYFTPDYYVVAPHGAGMQSLIYYLYLLNIPTTYWWEQDQRFEELRNKYEYCGFLLASSLSGGGEEPFPLYLQAEKPVFWLLRDPVSLVTSVMNLNIGTTILKNLDASWHLFAPETCRAHHWNDLHTAIIDGEDDFPLVDMLYRLKNFKNLTIFDVSDLFPDKVMDTMQDIYTKVTLKSHSHMSIFEDKLKISYNNFESRLWRFGHDFSIKENENITFNVRIFPKRIADYRAQYYREPYYVDFVYNNVSYRLYSDSRYPDFAEYIFSQNTQQIYDALEEKLSKKDYALKHYERMKMSHDDVINFLLQDKAYGIEFIRKQFSTIKFLTTIGKIPKWPNFEKLCAAMS